MVEPQPCVEVRYQHHKNLSGGSVWVKVQNRPYNYADEWQCVWSTNPAARETRCSELSADFMEATAPGGMIPIPLEWLGTDAITMNGGAPELPPAVEQLAIEGAGP